MLYQRIELPALLLTYNLISNCNCCQGDKKAMCQSNAEVSHAPFLWFLPIRISPSHRNYSTSVSARFVRNATRICNLLKSHTIQMILWDIPSVARLCRSERNDAIIYDLFILSCWAVSSRAVRSIFSRLSFVMPCFYFPLMRPMSLDQQPFVLFERSIVRMNNECQIGATPC